MAAPGGRRPPAATPAGGAGPPRAPPAPPTRPARAPPPPGGPPPAHGRLRKPAARAFTPRRVAAMEPRIRATVGELLDAVDASAPFDLVAALCFPLPATIICSFMGVPAADWDQLTVWCGSRT